MHAAPPDETTAATLKIPEGPAGSVAVNLSPQRTHAADGSLVQNPNSGVSFNGKGHNIFISNGISGTQLVIGAAVAAAFYLVYSGKLSFKDLLPKKATQAANNA